jgi:hypothetical protein
MIPQLKWTYTKRPEGQEYNLKEYTLKLEVEGEEYRRWNDTAIRVFPEINGKTINLLIIIYATDEMLGLSTNSYEDRNDLVDLACEFIEQNPYQEGDETSTEASQSGTSVTKTESTF